MLSILLSFAMLLPAFGRPAGSAPAGPSVSAPAEAPLSPSVPVAATPSPSRKAPANAPTSRSVVGQIVAIVPPDGEPAPGTPGATIVLRETVRAPRPGEAPREKETISVRVERTTQFLRGKRSVPFDDIRPGDQAVVRYAPGFPTGLALTVRVADVVARPATAPGGPTLPSAGVGASN